MFYKKKKKKKKKKKRGGKKKKKKDFRPFFFFFGRAQKKKKGEKRAREKKKKKKKGANFFWAKSDLKNSKIAQLNDQLQKLLLSNDKMNGELGQKSKKRRIRRFSPFFFYQL